MGFYLANRVGRIVEVDSEKEYYRWLAEAGFRAATPEEEEDYRRDMQNKHDGIFQNENKSVGVFFASVSPGGKDGYGVASDSLFKQLSALGMNIDRHMQGQEVAVLFHAPFSAAVLSNRYQLIYSMFESTKTPEEWKEYLQAADVVVVPSHWCKEVFDKCNDIDCKVVPLGYDDAVFGYVDRKVKVHTTEDFIFLHYNAFNMRKGFLEVLKAFEMAFSSSDPVKLVLKTNNRSLPFPFPPSQYPNIRVIKESYSDKQLARLCAQSDCFVFPSRGEGFGITPLEAMATGMPAIVPNAHGISEYFNSDYMYGVRHSPGPAIYSRYKDEDVGEMVICDVEDLAKKMRWVFEHQEEAKEKGRNASEYVKKYSIRNTAIALKELVDEMVKTEPKPKQDLTLLRLEKVA